MTSRWPHDTPSFSSRNRSQFSVSESYRLMGQNNFEPTQSQYNIVYDKKYVEDLRKSFLEQQTEKRVIRNNEKLGTEARHIQRRLKEHGHPVELGTLTCLSGHCGRSFERIQVLAFHVSYAHQDLMTSHSSHLTCLLCGKKWTTVRVSLT
uniref:C2H2-type domain-containing protein n=1 Tax=Caenorhabditis japonica TaxID=281687 RepID=A0A8R1DWZ0_CAEJA